MMRSLQLLVMIVIAGLAQPAWAAGKPHKAVGSATCGTSTCHAAEEPWPNSAVTQKEFLVWKQRDPHARAYTALQSDKGRRIARRLGLGNAAEAKLCLSCHNYTPKSGQFEPNFSHTEGVSCEACHGAASNWLGVHQSGLYFYGKNIEKGMYPTTEPRHRAELCLSCHVGTPQKFVSHKLLSVGHPRLPFELGFYTWFTEGTPGRPSNYAHFTVDDDYLQRKPWPFGVRVWAIGQVAQARQLLDLLTNPLVGTKGLFPEFAFFRCDSCHGTKVEGPGVVGTYGLPRLNDANLYFVEVAASLVNRGLARDIRNDIRALRAVEDGDWPQIRAVVTRLKRRLDGLMPLLEKRAFTFDDSRLAIRAISNGANRGVFRGYIAAEQAILAAGSLVDELEKAEELDPARAKQAHQAVRKGLAAFVSEDHYRAGQVNAALRDVARIAAN